MADSDSIPRDAAREPWEVLQARLANLEGEDGIAHRRAAYREHFLQLAEDVRIEPGCYFAHPGNIALEQDVRINRGAIMLGSGGIRLGRHARIGPRCFIHSANHDIDPQDPRALFERGYTAATVFVGDNSLISADVRLLPGCTLGDGSFVAAGATVVGKEHPAGAFLAGSPARLMRPAPSPGMTTREPRAIPAQVMVVAPNPIRAAAWRHLVSVLGLPQVAVAEPDELLPAATMAVIVDGLPAAPRGVRAGTISWRMPRPDPYAEHVHAARLADGQVMELPAARTHLARPRVSDRSDARTRARFCAVWIRDRLLKRREPLSATEAADWLVAIRVLDIVPGRSDRLFERLLAAVCDRWPADLAGSSSPDTIDSEAGFRAWYEKALNSIASTVDCELGAPRSAHRKACLQIPALLADHALRHGAAAWSMLEACAPSCNTGHRLVALSIAARIAGHAEPFARAADALLDGPSWRAPDEALPRSTERGARPLLSPLVVAWWMLRAEGNDAAPSAAEGLFDELRCSSPLKWLPVVAPGTDGAGAMACPESRLVSTSLLEGWIELHGASVGSESQLFVDDGSYAPWIRNLEAVWLDAFALVFSSAGLPMVRLRPWPAPFRAAVSVRFDVDRPVAAAMVRRLVSLQSHHLNAPCGSWYVFPDDPNRGRMTELLARSLQELGLHLRHRGSSERGLGVTMHSSPDADYWAGDATVDALAAGHAAYGEFLAGSFDTPRRALGGSGTAPELPLVPLHFPLEGGTADTNLDYFDQRCREFRERLSNGGHAVIGTHPDVAEPLLELLLRRENFREAWATSVSRAVARTMLVMGHGSIQASCDADSIRLWCASHIADLALDVLTPNGARCTLTTQLQARAERRIDWRGPDSDANATR
jgi:acetyltransferase-like isoleucine patch superfamily enzyme